MHVDTFQTFLAKLATVDARRVVTVRDSRVGVRILRDDVTAQGHSRQRRTSDRALVTAVRHIASRHEARHRSREHHV